MKKIIIFIILIVFSTTLLFSQKGDSPERNIKDIKPDDKKSKIESSEVYDQNKIIKIINELLPVVENIAGKKFIEKVKTKLVKESELAKVLAEEFSIQYKNITQEKNEEIIKLESNSYGKLLASSMLGKYGFQNKTLYFVPNNFEKIMKRVKIGKEFYEDILKLIVAHELCHALQDQHGFITKQIFSIKNQDTLSTFSALIEGHAMLIMEKVGMKLNMNKSYQECMKLFSMESFEGDDEIIKNLKKIMSSQFNLLYIQGKKFIDYHYNNGGTEKIWKIFEKPPIFSSTIFKPEQYGKEKVSNLDLKSCMMFLHDEFKKEDGWIIQDVKLSKFQISAAYVNLPEEHRNKITSNIIDNGAFIASLGNKSLFNVTILMLDKNLKGSDYIGYMENYIKVTMEKSKTSKIKIENLKIEKFRFDGADSTSDVKIKLDYMGQSKINVRAVRISKEDVLMEFILSNYDLEDKKIYDFADRIMKGFQKQKAK